MSSHRSVVLVLCLSIAPYTLFPKLTAAESANSPEGARDFVYMVRVPSSQQHGSAIQTGFRLRGVSGIVTALHGVAGGGTFSAINDQNKVINILSSVA